MENNIVRFILKGISIVFILCPLFMFCVFSDGVKKSHQDFEDFKVQIQRIDGSVVKLPSDYSYVDITIPEGNYNIIK